MRNGIVVERVNNEVQVNPQACVSALKPHDIHLVLQGGKVTQLHTVHYIKGQPFTVDIESVGENTDNYDVCVAYEQLSNPIKKQGLTGAQINTCCEKFGQYLTSLNASTQEQVQFAELFTQFTSICEREITADNYVIQANELTTTFNLWLSTVGATEIFTVVQLDSLYPVGASLADGKHCILSSEDSLMRILHRY